jgi:phosphatidylinositol-3,4,5-trisphosphate 3-phosphatase/dual-specificity protein phosphatase PTEN
MAGWRWLQACGLVGLRRHGHSTVRLCPLCPWWLALALLTSCDVANFLWQCPKSERDYDYANFQGRVSHFPFDDHNPPLVSTCVAFCEDAHAWMTEHPSNVIAVHCKAGKGRTGCMIGCYLQHCGEHPDPNEALKFYGKARVSNGKGVTIPSQARYVRYYSRVMRHEVPTVLPVLRLEMFRMLPVPSHMSEDSTYFVICQNDSEVYNSNRKVSFNTNHGRATPVDYKCRLEVCGDITIEVFDKKSIVPGAPRRKSRMFQVAFHTAFIEDYQVSFTRAEVDTGTCVDGDE